MNSSSAHAAPLGINDSGLLKGTATPSFPAGAPGQLSVVDRGQLAVSPGGTGELPFVLRNNTSGAISHIDATATVRGAGGALVATGRSQGTTPAQAPPGGLVLGYIYFENAKSIPATARFDFTFESVPADTSAYNTATAKTVEANRSGDSVVGTGVNTTGKALSGPYAVHVYCFAGNHVLSEVGTFADQSADLPPQGRVTFSANLYGANCPTFLVGITGYYR